MTTPCRGHVADIANYVVQDYCFKRYCHHIHSYEMLVTPALTLRSQSTMAITGILMWWLEHQQPASLTVYAGGREPSWALPPQTIGSENSVNDGWKFSPKHQQVSFHNVASICHGWNNTSTSLQHQQVSQCGMMHAAGGCHHCHCHHIYWSWLLVVPSHTPWTPQAPEHQQLLLLPVAA